jgi:hypothetical protein
MQTLKISLLILAICLGLYLIDQLGLWAERKGWIFWRKTKPTGNSLGSTALELQKIFDSGKSKHVIEVKDDQRKDSPDTGSGPA